MSQTEVKRNREFDHTPPEPVDKYDRYGPYNPDHGLSVCPYCGRDIEPTEEVVTVDGRRGYNGNLLETAPGLNLRTYHPRCYRKRNLIARAVENRSIFGFLDE